MQPKPSQTSQAFSGVAGQGKLTNSAINAGPWVATTLDCGTGNTTRSGRPLRPSAGQKKTNENKADAAAKTRHNKEKAKRAAARKSQRSDNDAQAAALRDATNAPGPGELSPEEQIAALTARLQSAEARNDALNRKNKKLHRAVRRQAAPNDSDSQITAVPKPKGKFNLQEAMGLMDDRALFTGLQAGIHALALEAKIDFKSAWSQQEPGTVAKILRVAEERHSYLSAKRFPRHWATSSILQRYINSVRAYNSAKVNPSSGVCRRRQRVTNLGRLELETRRGRRVIISPPPEEEDQMDLDNSDGAAHSLQGSPSRDEDTPHVNSEDEDSQSEPEGPRQRDSDDSNSEEEEEELPVAED